MAGDTVTYVIWLDKNVVGCETEVSEITFDDSVSAEEMEETLRMELDTMISNSLDTGWCRKEEWGGG